MAASSHPARAILDSNEGNLMAYALVMFVDNLLALRTELGFSDEQNMREGSSFEEQSINLHNQLRGLVDTLVRPSESGEAGLKADLWTTLQQVYGAIQNCPHAVPQMPELKYSYLREQLSQQGLKAGQIVGTLVMGGDGPFNTKLIRFFSNHAYYHVGLLVWGNTDELMFLDMDIKDTNPNRARAVKDVFTPKYCHGASLVFRQLQKKKGLSDVPHPANLMDQVLWETSGVDVYNFDFLDNFSGAIDRAKLKAHRSRYWCSEFVAMALQRAKVLKNDRLPHAWMPRHFAGNELTQHIMPNWDIGTEQQLIMDQGP